MERDLGKSLLVLQNVDHSLQVFTLFERLPVSSPKRHPV